MDEDDINEAFIKLIMAKLRRKLTNMKIPALKERATEVGATADEISATMGEHDTPEALIKLIHSKQASKDCCDREPLVGDLVITSENEKRVSNDSAGNSKAWVLELGQTATVVEVRTDKGDFRLCNPDGMESGFVRRDDFAYKKAPKPQKRVDPTLENIFGASVDICCDVADPDLSAEHLQQKWDLKVQQATPADTSPIRNPKRMSDPAFSPKRMSAALTAMTHGSRPSSVTRSESSFASTCRASSPRRPPIAADRSQDLPVEDEILPVGDETGKENTATEETAEANGKELAALPRTKQSHVLAEYEKCRLWAVETSKGMQVELEDIVQQTSGKSQEKGAASDIEVDSGFDSRVSRARKRRFIPATGDEQAESEVTSPGIWPIAPPQYPQFSNESLGRKAIRKSDRLATWTEKQFSRKARLIMDSQVRPEAIASGQASILSPRLPTMTTSPGGHLSPNAARRSQTTSPRVSASLKLPMLPSTSGAHSPSGRGSLGPQYDKASSAEMSMPGGERQMPPVSKSNVACAEEDLLQEISSIDSPRIHLKISDSRLWRERKASSKAQNTTILLAASLQEQASRNLIETSPRWHQKKFPTPSW
jgi:hypothetical protein